VSGHPMSHDKVLSGGRTDGGEEHSAGGFPRFSAAEYRRRYGALEEIAQRLSLDGVVVYGGPKDRSVHWLTNWLSTMEAYVVWVPGQDSTLLVQLGNHVHTAQTMAVVSDVRFAGSGPHGEMDSRPGLLQAVRDRGLARGRVGFSGPVPRAHFAALQDAFPDAELVNVSAEVGRLQLIRSEEEFERLGQAAALADASVLALRDALRPGLNEMHLPRIIQDAYLDHGAYNVIHFAVSTSMHDPDAAVPSQYHRDRTLRSGDVVIVEISAGLWGYSGQSLRTFAVGSEPTDAYALMHETAMEAFARAEATIRPGSTVEDVHDAGEIIHERGFTIIDDFLHGASQTRPIVRTRQTIRAHDPEFRFEPGMAFVVQPNVTTKDLRSGVQFGEMLRVTETGTAPVHTAPRELFVCR
jgi:Xaa-Pro dipeptidase